jgi:hypothetical protein
MSEDVFIDMLEDDEQPQNYDTMNDPKMNIGGTMRRRSTDSTGLQRARPKHWPHGGRRAVSDTPRTDAMRLKMAQLGWPSDGEPVAMLMTGHGELERELAAERALADRLASALTDSATWNHALPAYEAWKEARRDP